MKKVEFGQSGTFVPAIGQGTWKMGEDPAMFNREVDALRAGIEAGLTLIDTAEMYSDGVAEQIVAEAIKDCRDDIFLVTKVWPTNGSYDGVLRSAAASLKRLQTDVIDLYLLHWPSAEYPLAETMRAMKKLIDDGSIRCVGVSNFDVALMQEAQDILGDHHLTSNQVVYHLNNRVIEEAVLPHCQAHNITVMAYSPLGAGSFPAPGTAQRTLLDEVAAKYDATAFQIALAWLIAHKGVVAIPKSSNPDHVRDNARALEITLSPEDIAAVAAGFPAGDETFQAVRH